MNDPSCFTNLHEYYTFIYAISYMMLVEVGIWIYNFRGWLRKPDKKNSDYGTLLIVILGCWGSFYFSTYFRSQMCIRDRAGAAPGRPGGGRSLPVHPPGGSVHRPVYRLLRLEPDGVGVGLAVMLAQSLRVGFVR